MILSSNKISRAKSLSYEKKEKKILPVKKEKIKKTVYSYLKEAISKVFGDFWKKEEDRFKSYMSFPLNYKFNGTNVKKFLLNCDDDVREIAKKIIINTRHVSFEELLMNITKNIKHMLEYIDEKRPLFIYVKDKYKEKSNYWIYLYICDYIKYFDDTIEIILLSDPAKINHPKMIEDDIIIFIDDCIYTGSQMYHSIKNLKPDKPLKAYILTSYISRDGKELIETLTNFEIIFNRYIEYIPKTRDYLTRDEIDKIETYYNKDDFNWNETFFGKYSIYFDHKLADYVSTMPLFYSGVVPNTHNREILIKLDLYNTTANDIKKINKLQIIPLFRNCEHIRNVNIKTPICPSTPYKKEMNEKFMRMINKNRKALSI